MTNLANRLLVRTLGPDDETALRKAISKWTNDPNFTFVFDYNDQIPYSRFLEHLRAQERGEVAPGLVANTMYFGFLDGEIVGRLSLRHTLNEKLAKVGGHIGYGIIPEYRQRGFATEMLRRCLPLAKAVGIERALLTCDEFNEGSIRTIEACGGVLESIIEAEAGHPRKRRYWIDIP